MATNPYKTKKFQELKDRWYKKLEKEGFEDIEQDENNLKQWDSFNFSGSKRTRYDRGQVASKEEYYRLAGQFLHEHTFENPVERLIWENHANGLSTRQIAEVLKKKRKKSKSHRYAHLIIKQLMKVMFKKHGIESNN